MFVTYGLDGLYERDVAAIGDECSELNGYIVNCGIVLQAHYCIADYFYDTFGGGLSQAGVMNRSLLISCVARQFTEFLGVKKWKNNYEMCATIVYGIVKNHCFYDANKRTAVLVMLYYMYHVMGLVSTAKKREIEDFIVKVADGTVLGTPVARKILKAYPDSSSSDREVYTIARFIRNNSRRRDNNHYNITFKKLDTLLHAHGFCLSSPFRNQIDICEFLNGEVGNRICQIGFPGWTKEVPKSTVKMVRMETGLVEAKGVDSYSFYYGGDPLFAIINEYSSLMKRLADR